MFQCLLLPLSSDCNRAFAPAALAELVAAGAVVPKLPAPVGEVVGINSAVGVGIACADCCTAAGAKVLLPR